MGLLQFRCTLIAGAPPAPFSGRATASGQEQSYGLVRFTWESGKGTAISTYEDFPARNVDFKLIT
jgi:hypothetical protein